MKILKSRYGISAEMTYSSYARFQGAWVGSIIGSALGDTDQINTPDCQKIITYQFHDWLEIREKIARYLVKAQKIEAQHISKQLTPFLVKLNDTQSNSVSITSSSELLSVLLPLIIFDRNNEATYTELISRCNLDSICAIEIKEAISLWTYLLTLILANQFPLKDTNISMIVKQLLGGVEERTTSSIAKWNIVNKAIKHGSSIQQLTEQICQTNSNKSDRGVMLAAIDAICLALFCFASTPHNFMLSVKRASHLPGNLSQAVTTLTATISGAYNGLTGIPRNWRSYSDRHPGFQQTNQTFTQLYQAWLGMHNLHHPELLYSPNLDAVALPKIIQPRQNLKIISQKF